MRPGLVLVWALIGGALAAAAPAPSLAAPEQPRPSAGRIKSAQAQAEYDNAIRNPEVRRFFDDQLTAKQQEIDRLKQQAAEATAKLAQAKGRSRADRAEVERLTARVNQLTVALAEAQQWFVDELARRDRTMAREIAAFRGTVTRLLDTPEGLRIVELANAGDVEASWQLGQELIRETSERERAASKKRDDIAEAVRVRDLAMFHLGKVSISRSIEAFERVVELDPAMHWDWVELSRLYVLANNPSQAERAARRAELTSTTDRERMISWGTLADIYARHPDRLMRGRAEVYYGQALDIAKVLAARDPRDAAAQHDLSVSYDKLGDVLLYQPSGRAKALEYYTNSLAIREALARADPRHLQFQRDLSVSYSKLGAVYLTQVGGGQAQALEYLGKSLAIRERLAKDDPRNTQAQRDLSNAYEKLGDAQLSQPGGKAAALAYYRKSLAIREALARADPFNTDAQLSLSISYDRLADVHREQPGGRAMALEYYGKSLVIREELVRKNPLDSTAQRGISINFISIGDIYQANAENFKALSYYFKSFVIRKALVNSDPGDREARRNLAVNYERIGYLLIVLTESKLMAVIYYEKSFTIVEALAREDPRNPSAQRDLAAQYWKMAVLGSPNHSWQRVVDQYELMQKDGLFDASDVSRLEDARRRRDQEAQKAQAPP